MAGIFFFSCDRNSQMSNQELLVYNESNKRKSIYHDNPLQLSIFFIF